MPSNLTNTSPTFIVLVQRKAQVAVLQSVKKEKTFRLLYCSTKTIFFSLVIT